MALGRQAKIGTNTMVAEASTEITNDQHVAFDIYASTRSLHMLTLNQSQAVKAPTYIAAVPVHPVW